MEYYCPVCSCMRKPKIVRYFPPIIAKCTDCGYENSENKFIKEEKSQTTIIH